MERDTMFLFGSISDMIESVERMDMLAEQAGDNTLRSEIDTFAQSVARSIARQVDDYLDGHTMRKVAPKEVLIKECDPELEHLLDHDQPMDGCTICAYEQENREIDDPETHHYINHQMLNLVSPACEFCMHHGK